MRTLTIKRGTGGTFTEGWNEVTVTKANYGDWEGNKFLDLWFKDYPESLNLRIYAKKGKDGEEFAIGRVFRFANAGIQSVSSAADGESLVTIDDSPGQLVNKELNVFLYKEGDYFRILSNVAPTVFGNEVESFGPNDVEYWKKQAEKYYDNYIVASKSPAEANGGFTTTTTMDNTTAEWDSSSDDDGDDMFAGMPE
jgi:hypothetical protein